MATSKYQKYEAETINRSKIKNAPYNPRRMDDAAKKLLRRNLKKHGLVEALVWNRRTGNLVGGHQRLEQLDSLEQSKDYDLTLNVVDVDEKEEATLNVQLNQRSMQGDWDIGKLSSLIADFDFDLKDDLAFSDADIDSLFKGDERFAQFFDVEEDDFDVDEELEQPVFSMPGDVWHLGRHVVVCGDSTKEEDVWRLMGKEKADLFCIDPPYNVDYQGGGGGTSKRKPIKNDCMSDEQYREFLRNAFTVAKGCMKAGAAFYIWHADAQGFNVRGACNDVGWEVRECLIWKKDSLVLGRQDYQWIHEPCLYGWNEGTHAWYSDRKQTTVLEFPRPKVSKAHPTMKPVRLISYLVQNSSKEGDIILDTFLGSGTALVACEQTNRVCRGMELDPKFVDVEVKRYIELRGGADDVYVIRDGKKRAVSAVLPKQA